MKIDILEFGSGGVVKSLCYQNGELDIELNALEEAG